MPPRRAALRQPDGNGMMVLASGWARNPDARLAHLPNPLPAAGVFFLKLVRNQGEKSLRFIECEENLGWTKFQCLASAPAESERVENCLVFPASFARSVERRPLFQFAGDTVEGFV